MKKLILLTILCFFSNVSFSQEIPDSIKNTAHCEETYINGEWFHTFGKGRCPPGSKKSYSSQRRHNCPSGNVQTSYECANQRLDDVVKVGKAAQDAIVALGQSMAAKMQRESNERMARYLMFVYESFQGVKDEDKYKQQNLTEPQIDVISASYRNEEVLIRNTGFYSDCVIPHFDNSVEKMGGWTILIQKDSPVCKLKAKDKSFYPTYYNQISSNDVAPSSFPYVLQKKRKGYRMCVTAMGMKAGCAKNKKEDEFTYAVGFVSDNSLPSQSVIFGGKYGEILRFFYSEGNLSEEVQLDLSKTNVFNYKGASFEILDSSYEEITFKVLSHF